MNKWKKEKKNSFYLLILKFFFLKIWLSHFEIETLQQLQTPKEIINNVRLSNLLTKFDTSGVYNSIKILGSIPVHCTGSDEWHPYHQDQSSVILIKLYC